MREQGQESSQPEALGISLNIQYQAEIEQMRISDLEPISPANRRIGSVLEADVIPFPNSPKVASSVAGPSTPSSSPLPDPSNPPSSGNFKGAFKSNVALGVAGAFIDIWNLNRRDPNLREHVYQILARCLSFVGIGTLSAYVAALIGGAAGTAIGGPIGGGIGATATFLLDIGLQYAYSETAQPTIDELTDSIVSWLMKVR